MSLPVPAEQTHLAHPKYRADIDGLRAIAVLSVVGFHAFPFWVQGGFIGVDIFFVISGFLISSIIFKNLHRDSFSFIEFYSRRIKRIFPALLVVLIASFALGWFVLFADEYKQLGWHIAGGAGFIENFLLWRESGYFDNAAETKPLLHLWTLAIEEQFYIVWPLVLWFAWKTRLNLLIIAIAVAMISFALNIGKVHSDAVAAFYSPQTRFWELMAGSILAYIKLYKQNIFDAWPSAVVYKKITDSNPATLHNIQSIFGAALIGAGILVIKKYFSFPGWWAVLPTFGAVLIISAGPHAWINRVILSRKILVWFGLISYPLYLWHWPLLSFARIVEIGIPSGGIRIAVVAISIVLSWLTYRLIEKPIRFGKFRNAKTIVLILLMAIVGLVGYTSYSLGGLPFRFKGQIEFLEYFDNSLPEHKFSDKMGLMETQRKECDFYDIPKYRIGQPTKIPLAKISESCYTRDTMKTKSVFIWGDSHAQQLYFGLRQNLPKEWQILQVASSGCSPDAASNTDPSIDYCSKSNLFALSTIKNTKPNVVIVAQNVGHQVQDAKSKADKLKNIGVKNIIFTGPSPHWKAELPKIIARKLWDSTPERTYVGINENVIEENRKFKSGMSKIDDVTFVDLIDLFCNQNGCLTRIGNDKMTGITSYDYGHLLPVASDYLAKNLLVPKILEISSKK